MKKHRVNIRVVDLIANVHYDPITGIFTSKTSRANNKIKVGQKLGSLTHKGYLSFALLTQKGVLAHRAAIAYMTGVWPDCQVDHIDRNKSNNAFSNLRLCPNDNSDNRQNMPLQKNNTSGVSGVHYMKESDAWRARIGVQGKRISLGLFKSKEAAIKAREEAVKNYHPFSTSYSFNSH